ncbi:MAG TPA: hypothetical protein VHW71_11085 [Steroidobacteraceae bacterium]|jgi:ElaB/YqjD/DUF883 family membrane-anchored ribosome-binding protein|nr:hypothetical protein [Steroidobacteraceae bacterium]
MNSNVADNASPQIEELRSRVGETVKSARSAIADANSAAMETFKNVANSADEYVRENPWVAIGLIAGVAASLGFLAGYLAAPQKSFLASLRR